MGDGMWTFGPSDPLHQTLKYVQIFRVVAVGEQLEDSQRTARGQLEDGQMGDGRLTFGHSDPLHQTLKYVPNFSVVAVGEQLEDSQRKVRGQLEERQQQF